MNIAKELQDYTVLNSNFETKRDYVSLSNIYLLAEELVEQYKDGFFASVADKLKCYKGYQMERDLVSRLKALYGDRIKTGIEISTANGLIKGHPDFTFDGFPCDCKSVLKDEWIPFDTLPKKVSWQMQAYMLYSNSNKALVLYESRETGLIQDFILYPSKIIQCLINEKVEKIISLLKIKNP